jgi:hypothetical protein
MRIASVAPIAVSVFVLIAVQSTKLISVQGGNAKILTVSVLEKKRVLIFLTTPVCFKSGLSIGICG